MLRCLLISPSLSPHPHSSSHFSILFFTLLLLQLLFFSSAIYDVYKEKFELVPHELTDDQVIRSRQESEKSVRNYIMCIKDADGKGKRMKCDLK